MAPPWARRRNRDRASAVGFYGERFRRRQRQTIAAADPGSVPPYGRAAGGCNGNSQGSFASDTWELLHANQPAEVACRAAGNLGGFFERQWHTARRRPLA